MFCTKWATLANNKTIFFGILLLHIGGIKRLIEKHLYKFEAQKSDKLDPSIAV